MDSTLSHDAVVELLGAFAIDAVEPGEAAAVESHLAGCARCRDEVAQYQHTAAMLANCGGEAPAGLWDAIAARIEPLTNVVSAFPVLAPPSSAALIQRRRLRHRVGRQATALTAAAAVAAIALLGAEVGHLDHRLNQLTAASAGQSLTAAGRSALLDPSARRVTLAGTGPGGPVVAEVVALRSGEAFLFNEGLPTVPKAETYQLWAMIDGQPISVGLLGTHPATVAFSVDAATATNAFAVTVEPAGGSVAPTRPPVASTTI